MKGLLGLLGPLKAWFDRLDKGEKFMAIMGALVLAGTLLSVVARYTVVLKDDSSSFRIALVAPLSGPSAEIGKSMEQGARHFVEALNRAGGVGGRTIVLDVHDEGDDTARSTEIAREIAAKGEVVAVVGHWSADSVRAASTIYEKAAIPLIAAAPAWPLAKEDERRYLFQTVFDAVAEARFLSNYARNVEGHKLMSVVAEDSEYGSTLVQAFDETFRRFGAPPQFVWKFDPSPEKREASIAALVEEYRARRDEAGALFLAADEISGPLVVKAFRDAGLRTIWFGPSRLATNAFAGAFKQIAARGDEAANYTNGMTVSAPLTFDTANEAAQNFKVVFRQKHGTDPDWVAAYAHDGVKLVAEAIRATGLDDGGGARAEKRESLRAHLAGMTIAQNGVRGVTGLITFQEGGLPATPVQMGRYNGASLVAALTQLQPIPRGAVSNYIEEVRQGRVLYVNDRFMYKTNVVYVGLQVKEISELDLATETATVDFSIWFRYRGSFNPHDVVFLNEAQPVSLGEPADQGEVGDLSYRLYRVKGRFNMNFSGAKRIYGSHIVGMTFRHRALNRNNVLYVVDVLGMPSGDALRDRLVEDKVIPPGLGWNIDRAWVAQEVSEEDALGAPKYVGYGSIAPDFSKIDLGIVIKKGGLSARDVVPTEWFVYLAIFGAVATAFSWTMDQKKWGRFWAVQSYGLRVVFWPMLLFAAGNLILDYAYQNMTLAHVYLAVTTYDVLWWAIPARLVTMGVRRFVWVPIEEKAERAIPNVLKMFVSFLIYALALLGVVAFVFNEPITSLLATSGLLAMIIGLAIQANLSNVFSGIVLNMERPFSVGDWVKIGSSEDARVTDITWRTTRLMTRSGMTMAIPNAKASESQIVNYSVEGRSRMTLSLFIDTEWPTEEVRKALYDAPLDVPGVLADPKPGTYFDGIVSADGEWLAQYSIQYWITDYSGKTAIAGRVWDAVHSRLSKAGIPLGAPGNRANPKRVADRKMGANEGEGGENKLEDKPEWEFVENEFENRI